MRGLFISLVCLAACGPSTERFKWVRGQDLSRGPTNQYQDSASERKQAKRNQFLLQQACGRVTPPPGEVLGTCWEVAFELKQEVADADGSLPQGPGPRFNRDFDRDGVPDRLDWDIDNDGVANLADQFPFDQRKKGQDNDRDGVPDFVDFEVNGRIQFRRNKKMAEIQSELWRKRGILFVQDRDVGFTQQEFERIRYELLEGDLAIFKQFPRLKVVHRTRLTHVRGQALGRYLPYWRTIQLANPKLFDQKRGYEVLKEVALATFVHEVFHVIARQQPLKLKEFSRKMGWDQRQRGPQGVIVYQEPGVRLEFSRYELAMEPGRKFARMKAINFPNRRAKRGPEEMFAEAGAATIAWRRLWKAGDPLASYRYEQMGFSARYPSSAAFEWMAVLLRN